MTTMSGNEATVHDRRWTVEDLARIDDETHIYELVDGRLDVSPRPAPPHVRAATRLATHLSLVRPDDVEVFHEPGLVMNRERTHYRLPDVAVFRAEPITMAQIEHSPLLAVEVLSPESALRDHHTRGASTPRSVSRATGS